MKPLDPRLLRRAAGVRLLTAGSVVLGLLAVAATIAQAVLLADVLADVIIGGSGWPDVRGRVIALAFLVLIRAGLAWTAEELASRSATIAIAQLRRELLVHAAALGPRWRSSAHGGELAVLVGTGLDGLHNYLARYLPQLVLSALVPVTVLVYLATADLTSAIIVVITLPLIPLFMALVGWYTDRQTKQKWESLSRLAGHFTDVVAGLPTLKVFGRARAQAASVRRIAEDYRRATMSTLRVAFLSSMVLELLASLSVALVAVTVGLRLVSGHLTLQVGLAVLIMAPEAYLPLRAVGAQFHAAADGIAATEQALAILELPVPPAGHRTDTAAVPGLRVDGMVAGGAVLEARVESHGPHTDSSAEGSADLPTRGVVGPVDLDIPAGRITVITGPSGAGKTTLLQVLGGLLRPSEGRVLVQMRTSARPGGPDAADPAPDQWAELTEIASEYWRSHIAWAGQRPALRAGTIRDNLEAPQVDDALRRQALGDVAADFVDDLPDGLDTVLGQDGAGLSQGQRQRICLARVVLRADRAGLVLLDEPTAALDDVTELRVLAGLGRALAGATVVLVTHRSAPLAIADHTVELSASDPTSGLPAVPQSMLAVSPW